MPTTIFIADSPTKATWLHGSIEVASIENSTSIVVIADKTCYSLSVELAEDKAILLAKRILAHYGIKEL